MVLKLFILFLFWTFYFSSSFYFKEIINIAPKSYCNIENIIAFSIPLQSNLIKFNMATGFLSKIYTIAISYMRQNPCHTNILEELQRQQVMNSQIQYGRFKMTDPKYGQNYIHLD